MNTIFSAKTLKLDKPISGNFDIVEDPNIDRNRTIPVKYTLKKRSEGTLKCSNVGQCVIMFWLKKDGIFVVRLQWESNLQKKSNQHTQLCEM